MSTRTTLTTTAPPKKRRWLSLPDAAAYTGFSTKTLRRRISDGSLTGYRAGPREIRLDLDELDELFRPIPSARRGGAA